jgi:hypothetical protein
MRICGPIYVIIFICVWSRETKASRKKLDMSINGEVRDRSRGRTEEEGKYD